MYREFKGDKTYILLIVPFIYRYTVMRLAHESIMSGHLTTSKTINIILPDFYLTGMK